jgi:hypothetical protein
LLVEPLSSAGFQAEGDPVNAPEHSFVILKFKNKVPALAACARCQHKFFTPNTYYNDRIGAEEYLRGKFDLHTCPDEPVRREWR